MPEVKKTRASYNLQGFSLVELLLVIVTIGFLVVLIAGIPNSLNLVGKSRHQSLAREIAVKQIEDKRAMQYDNLVNGTTNIADSRIGLLTDGSGTILLEDCSIQVCTSGESAKKITVTVSWKDSGKTQTLILYTLVAKGGLVK